MRPMRPERSHEEWIAELRLRLRYIHRDIIGTTGGSPGVRDETALESALSAAFATFGGQDLFPDPISKAGALLRSICLHHPFFDGNKRAAWVLAREFLLEHAITRDPDLAQSAIEEFMLAVAAGEVEIEKIIEWLREHTRTEDDPQ